MIKGYIPKTRKALWAGIRDARAPRKVQSGVRSVKTPVRPTKSVRQRSKRMTKLMAFYRELKVAYLLDNPRSAVYPQVPATQVHHTGGRAGTLLIDVRFWKGVDLCGHNWIQDQPEAARRQGFLCAKGLWNTPPEDAETRRLRDLIKQLTK